MWVRSWKHPDWKQTGMVHHSPGRHWGIQTAQNITGTIDRASATSVKWDVCTEPEGRWKMTSTQPQSVHPAAIGKDMEETAAMPDYQTADCSKNCICLLWWKLYFCCTSAGSQFMSCRSQGWTWDVLSEINSCATSKIKFKKNSANDRITSRCVMIEHNSLACFWFLFFHINTDDLFTDVWEHV